MQEDKYQVIFDKYQRDKGNVLTILDDLQQEFGFVPENAINWLTAKTNIPSSRFYGVSTYFKQFRLKPRGLHTVKVCCGAACHVKGAAAISMRIKSDLGLAAGDDTTDDGRFTIESISCAGACNEAPVVTVDDTMHGGLTPESTMKILANC